MTTMKRSFRWSCPRRIIKLLTAPEETVLDCFMGSGTTAVAAIRQGRNYIGVELQSNYVELARKRCAMECQKEAFMRNISTPGKAPANNLIQLALLEQQPEYALTQGEYEE